MFSFASSSTCIIRARLSGARSGILTGPSSPDSCSRSPLCQSRQSANVKRPDGLGLPSASHLGQASQCPVAVSVAVFGQVLIADHAVDRQVRDLISSALSPGLTAPVMSTAIGRFPHDPQVLAVELTRPSRQPYPDRGYSLVSGLGIMNCPRSCTLPCRSSI